MALALAALLTAVQRDVCPAATPASHLIPQQHRRGFFGWHAARQPVFPQVIRHLEEQLEGTLHAQRLHGDRHEGHEIGVASVRLVVAVAVQQHVQQRALLRMTELVEDGVHQPIQGNLGADRVRRERARPQKRACMRQRGVRTLAVTGVDGRHWPGRVCVRGCCDRILPAHRAWAPVPARAHSWGCEARVRCLPTAWSCRSLPAQPGVLQRHAERSPVARRGSR